MSVKSGRCDKFACRKKPTGLLLDEKLQLNLTSFSYTAYLNTRPGELFLERDFLNTLKGLKRVGIVKKGVIGHTFSTSL